MIIIYLFLFDTFSQQEPPVLWIKSYGGPGLDYGRSVVQTTDGGFFAAGYKETWYKGGNQVYLMRLSADGDSLWSKLYGIPDNGNFRDKAFSAQQTNDGGFIITGESYWDVGLLRTDSLGDTLWTKTIGTPNNETGYCVVQTNDGGFAIAGIHYMQPAAKDVVYLIRTNSDGDTLWTKNYMRIYSFGTSVAQTFDGGFIITGSTTDSMYSNTFLLKTNSDGDSLWVKEYKHGLRGDQGNCVKQTSDGGFIIAGQMERTSANYYISLIRTDSIGDTLCTRSEYKGVAYDIAQTIDGGFVLTGSWGDSPGGTFIMRTDQNGTYLWHKLIPHYGTGGNAGYSVIQTSDGGFTAVGHGVLDSNNTGGLNFVIARLDSEGNTIKKDNSKNKPASSDYNLTTNVIRNRIFITFTVASSGKVMIDLYGPSGKLVQELYEKNVETGSNSVEARLKRKLPNGVYIVKLEVNDVVVSKKINLVR